MSHDRTYIEHYDLIDGVITQICRRHRLAGVEADDFRASAHLKLIENDYEVFRKFQGRSSLRTYLTVVLQRVFLDYRIGQWGKWRPSMEASRRGPVAIRLEQLLVRDGFSFDEAVEILRARHGVAESREALARIAERLPVRVNRKLQGEKAMSDVPDPAVLPDEAAAREELRPHAVRARIALDEAMATLEPQDRLIVRLRFENGLGIADIARTLALPQRPLYRRLEQILARLRRHLEHTVGGSSARALLDEAWSDLADVDRMSPRGKPAPGSVSVFRVEQR